MRVKEGKARVIVMGLIRIMINKKRGIKGFLFNPFPYGLSMRKPADASGQVGTPLFDGRAVKEFA